MTFFISGGAKSGKSAFAQNLAVTAAQSGPLYYVATMLPSDDEDRRRIQKHRESRAGMGFQTIECARGICSALEGANRDGTFLLDSVTALLLNEMFPDPLSEEMDPAAPRRCIGGLREFARSVKNAVMVSDLIYCDALRCSAVTGAYRKGLADIGRSLAKSCDTVVEVAAGIPIFYKGGIVR